MLGLNHRARKILSTIAEEYISTGDAVGSSRVIERSGIDISPATVRLVMGELEHLGLLRQPHTSAGRVPTQQGLKFFVESLLHVRALSSKDQDEIRSAYALPQTDLVQTLQETGNLLSELSMHTVVVVSPSPELERLGQIEFIRLPQGILAVIVNQKGKIYNRFIKPDRDFTAEQLTWAQDYLNEYLAGKTLAEIRTLLAEEISHHQQLEQQALRLQAQAMPQQRDHVSVHGQSNLLGQLLHEDQNPEQLTALLKVLEDKRTLLRLLDSIEEARRIQVFIGSEQATLPELSPCSIVTAPFRSENSPVGLLGVIGPTRMDYSRVIALVDFTANLLSEALKE